MSNRWFAGWETQFTVGEISRLVSSLGFKIIDIYGRYHLRNIDRIQERLLKKKILPQSIEDAYYKLISSIENSPIGPRTAFSLGIISQKL